MKRGAALLIGLLPFVVFELVCLAAGWGERDVQVDPFVDFAGQRPLFVPTDDGLQMHTAPNRRGYFKEDAFAARKPEGEFRIFVFGGSTVQGNPFSIETSFPAYLQIALESACPERRWKVINCGGVSYASYRLLPIMEECFSYEPDLYVFCEGHNEFLEDVEHARSTAAPAVGAAFRIASNFRSFRLLHTTISAWRDGKVAGDEAVAGKPVLPAEVDTLLDHEGGLDTYHRDDAHAKSVAEHFRSNLVRMSERCRDKNVPLLFVLPPSNLSDCPPFKSQFSATTSYSLQRTILEHLRSAREAAKKNVPYAIQLATRACELDDRYALSWYELGQLQELGGVETAEASYRRARDEDVCPLRITSPLDLALRETARDDSRPLIDAHALLAERCPKRIVGGSVLVDHVHPSFRGHEDIAIAIAEWMLREGYLKATASDWSATMRTICAERLQSLDDLYFLRGQRSLETLRLWAAGRSGGPPLVPRTE